MATKDLLSLFGKDGGATASAVRQAIDRGALLNERLKNDVTMMHMAAAHHGTDVVQALIDGGADVQAADDEGGTPLHYAAIHNRLPETAAALIDGGADVNAKNEVGSTPLQYAVQQRAAPAFVLLLLERGADVRSGTVRTSATALHYAARNGAPEIVDLLIEHGADVGATSNIGGTPLHWFAQFHDDPR